VNAQTAKLYSTSAVFVNLAIVFAIFIPITWAVAPSRFWWVIVAGLIGALYFLFFHVLDKIAVSIKCPSCQRVIRSNTHWQCGFCPGKNRNTDTFSFLEKCEHCQAEPKAYKCHHADCGKLMFFTGDQQEQGFASCLEPESPVKTDDKKAVRLEAREELAHQIEMAAMKARLEATENRLKIGRMSRLEKLRESLEAFRHDHVGARRMARELKSKLKEELRDDPESLQDELDAIDRWLLDEGIDLE
jgi:hypothetical protein